MTKLVVKESEVIEKESNGELNLKRTADEWWKDKLMTLETTIISM